MKCNLIVVGDTHKKWAVEGENEYLSRLKFYIDFEKIIVPDIKKTKSLSIEQQKILEGKAILQRLNTSDVVWLLDEHGQEYGSIEFAGKIGNEMIRGTKRLVFLIGGPYGFSKEVYERANSKISFSHLTFPHDLIRVIFMEQLYRAMTIMNNEPYHHI